MLIEAAMYTALGFFIASLLALAILPAFYKRAVRLTKQALQAVNPATYAEVRAAQDQALARHAVELRRVEQALDRQRGLYAEEKMTAGKLRAELLTLKAAHSAGLAKLQAELQTAGEEKQTKDRNATDLAKIRAKLAETEKSLAAALAEADLLRQAREGADRWMPAEDTMALATITGLEAQVATLSAKLQLYEASGAETDGARPEIAEADQLAVIADLEKQLVDVEAKYIEAQSEVTRLIAQMNMSGGATDAQTEALLNDLATANAEKARVQAIAMDRDRALSRARAQLAQLRDDIKRMPELASLRDDLTSLARSLASDAKPRRGKTAAKTAQVANTANEAQARGGEQDKKQASRQTPLASAETTKRRTASKKTAVLNAQADAPALSPNALVRRVVNASRENRPDGKGDGPARSIDAGTNTKRDATGPTAPAAIPAASIDKSKKKDVA